MFPRLKAMFSKVEATPECFTGVGVVLICDQCSARMLGAPLSAAELVEVMNEVLSLQTDLIRRFDGIIDKYVGGCVIAYWSPRAMPRALSSAFSVACALQEKKEVGRVSFEMRVSFCAAEFSVTGFGPAGRQRYQAVGRAYDRANSMQSRLSGAGVITDSATFERLPEEARAGFLLQDGYACRTK